MARDWQEWELYGHLVLYFSIIFLEIGGAFFIIQLDFVNFNGQVSECMRNLLRAHFFPVNAWHAS